MPGATYRDGDDPQHGAHADTDLPARFNPTVDGKPKPNCTPDGYDYDEGLPTALPLFLDAALPGNPAPQAFWNLGGFVRYLCRIVNPDETWAKNPVPPTGETIDDYLQSVTPVAGQFMDLTKPATYTKSPIVLRSFDATGKTLVNALHEQLRYHGFEIFLDTREDPDDPGRR